MPSGSSQSVRRITLTMTEEEAAWLKGYMQNPKMGATYVPETDIYEEWNETDGEKEMRTAFWEALNHLLKEEV